MAKRKTVFVDADILVIGGGFGGCGAAYARPATLPLDQLGPIMVAVKLRDIVNAANTPSR